MPSLAMRCGVEASWVQSSASGPSARGGESLAYDSTRGRTVLFGGNNSTSNFLSDTWEFDGTDWQQLQVSGPSPRYLAPMAFDSLRGVSVLFGGYGFSSISDTWEWDGASWRRNFTAHSPPWRDWTAMTYDSRRHVMVLFGGTAADGSVLNDTWEYDGTDWSQVANPHAPPARRGHSLAFDWIRGIVVLFGGQADLNLNDTWEYDGNDWTQVSVGSAPPARLWHSSAFDPALGGTVVFGGYQSGAPLSDTWLYDGASWHQITSPSRPSDRFWSGLVFDSGHSQLILFGGAQDTNTQFVFGDTWSLVGMNTLPVNWSQSSSTTAPAARVWPAMDYDSHRGVTVMFGGSTGGPGSFADTWEWDGFAWTQRGSQTSPPALAGASMAYDSRRHVSVLFGGQDASGALSASTWEWDGAGWTQRNLSPSPSARVFTSMVYDSNRGQMVLFGGTSLSTRLNDTWVFDGNAWTQLNPVAQPSPRDSAAMAFDSARGRTVLFGGRDANGREADTWEWDGTAWAKIATETTPYPRFWASMAFDAQRGKTVLFGGDHIQPYALGPTNDTWDWDGSQWRRDWTAAAPAVRAGQATAFDSHRDRVVLFGGFNAAISPNTYYGDTWELGSGIVTPAGDAALTMNPSSLDFGSVDFGVTSSSSVLYVSSSGTGPALTTMSTTGDFAVSSTDCPSDPNPLAAGSSCLVFLTFTPTAIGDRYGSLVFTGNVAGGSQSIALHGVGLQRDFTISSNPASLSMIVGSSQTAAINTTVLGDGGTISLSTASNDPGISASLNPYTITAGSSSTMTVVVRSSVTPGNYSVRVLGTEGAISHYVDVPIEVLAVPDFTIAVSPANPSMAQGGTATATVSTTAVGTVGTIFLSTYPTPPGLTASLSPSSVTAGGVATLTISVSYGAAPGDYSVVVVGTEGSITHMATVLVSVTLKGLVNGGFETGDTTGWSSTGTTAAVPLSHTGTYGGQIGSTSASDSMLSQTFTVPASGGKLTFWYRMSCQDKVKDDWFMVALLDGVTGTGQTILGPVCSRIITWTKVTVNLSSHAGHYVTLTFANHDDTNPADPTFTLVDDVVLS